MTGPSEHAFTLLRTASVSLGALRVRDAEVRTTGGTVLHGLDANDLFHLLVPLLPGEKPLADERSAGVQISPILLETDAGSRRYLDVICRLPHLNPLFFQVADEMLDAIRTDPSRAVLACHVVLDRWRELLERRKSKLLGPEQLMGLLGELLVLEQLALRDASLALAAWTGPQGHRFDFVSGKRAIEVKSSTTREGRSVEIHGDRQLDPVSGGDLHLFYMRFESREGSGETVPTVVDRILALGTPRFAFLEVLEQVGYSATDRSAYERIGFDVLESLVFAVDGDFPRITPSSFTAGSTPAGVSHLRYRVDLSGPTPVALNPASVPLLLNQFLSAE